MSRRIISSKTWKELALLIIIPSAFYLGISIYESWIRGQVWNPNQYESHKPRVLGTQECPDLRVLAFSPDSSFLVTGGGNYDVIGADVVHLWDIHSKTSLGSLIDLNHSQVDGASFSPDGKQLFVLAYTGGDLYPGQQKLELWDVKTRTVIQTVNGSPSPKLTAVKRGQENEVTSPDGRYIVNIKDHTITIRRIK